MEGRNQEYSSVRKNRAARIPRRMLGLFTRPLAWAGKMFARRPLGGFLVLLCAGSLVLSLLILYYAPVFREWMLAAAPARPAMAGDAAAHKKEVERIQGRIRNLQKKYAAITPRKPYLVVDTSNNKFRLMSGDKLIREGTCSTGSYVLLKAGDDRQWVFKTPRGRFHVQTKKESPVWYKPDWAFVEEGLPIPPPHSQERYEAGVLGDYALHIGDGYLIHGTLYKRLLGMPVTHGCVRLGDEDLEVVYKNLQVGSPVYIY